MKSSFDKILHILMCAKFVKEEMEWRVEVAYGQIPSSARYLLEVN